jgi:hypothetical protein
MTKLQISPELTFPADTVTSTIVVYGGKGMGKTNLGSVIAEELKRARQRFSVIDPVGVWWGLQYAADGKGPGLEVLILGGVHGDIPIEPTGGAIVADLVADEEVDVVIDISRRPNGSMWSAGDKIRFVTDYCTRLYERQGERRRPIMQIIDEAGRYVPQTMPSGAIDLAKCVGAIEQLVELGRNVGVGVCLITQRSARMNKSVSELAECMIAFRTVGPLSINAILDWFGEHVEKSRWKELLEQLRSLPRGHALVVSPGWLEFEGVVQVRARETFDSSATPTSSDRRRTTGQAAKPDLGKYRERMAATIEKAKADDPKALRARIAQLEAEAKKKPAAAGKTKTVEIPVVKPTTVKALERVVDRCDGAIARVNGVAVTLREYIEKAQARGTELQVVRDAVVGELRALRVGDRFERVLRTTLGKDAPAVTVVRVPTSAPRPAGGAGDASLPKGERAILTAAAQRPDGVTREQLTVLTGYKRSSRDTYVQRLRERGHLEAQGEQLVATQAGVDALGSDFEPLPTGAALRAHWLKELPEGERRVLEVVIGAYPKSIDREEISAATEYKRSSRDTYLQRLGARRLVTTERGQVRASEELF